MSVEKIPRSSKLSWIRGIAMRWFDRSGRTFPWREADLDNYSMIVSELLLQRTRAPTVAAFIPSFWKQYPSWKALAESSETELQHFIQPLGMWRRRSNSLRALAKEMVLRNGEFPHRRKDIEKLPGVGQYICNAILLFCHKRAHPLLDVNMARVLERVFGPRQLVDIRYDPYLQDLANRIVRCNQPSKINWAILDIAAIYCSKNVPKCELCPIQAGCLFGQRQEPL